MQKKIGIALGVAVVALLMFSWFTYADIYDYGEEIKVEPQSNISVLSSLPIADQVVKKRNPDVYLNDIVVMFPPRTILVEDMVISYLYTGTEYRLLRKRLLNYTISINAQKPGVAKVDVFPTNMDVAGYKSRIKESLIDIEKAIEIAEANGGKEFRKTNPDYKLLVRPGFNWIVEYKNLNSNSYCDLRILIDGRNGEIKEKELR